MNHKKLTVSQAIIKFLNNQYVQRDDKEFQFIKGVWGIFGHGNVAGISQALHQNLDMPYYLARNEQAMTHTAIAYSKARFRLQTFACTASVGPGSTNMITGAATATINRIPLLLLPSDTFARRNVAPVLQQLEYPLSQDVTVNDAFKPVSKYWDRINRPDQLPWAMLEAMRVLTSPNETGAVTICLPQDVQTEAHLYPTSLFKKRIWKIPRIRADKDLYEEAINLIKHAKKPFIISGGGILYSEASEELKDFIEKTGIPLGETQAGKGAISHDHQQNLGSIGATGSLAANKAAEQADVILLFGTRLSDFTTSSKSQFQNPNVRFIHVNVCSMDAHKLSSLPLQADAKVTLQEFNVDLRGYKVDERYQQEINDLKNQWLNELERVTNFPEQEKMQQPNIIRIVNKKAGRKSTVVCAAGSLPGDLHKLWKCHEPGGYHLEYGYSCMGYEIAGGLGVKMANPNREVVVMVGDGSYQMMSSELITAIQEGIKITVVLLNNHGFGSIGSLSESVGSDRFGTDYRYKNKDKCESEIDLLPIDFELNARSYGVGVQRVRTYTELDQALEKAFKAEKSQVIVAEVDREQKVPGYNSWWDVPVAETAKTQSAKKARKEYEDTRKRQRNYY
ncbi:MAG: 3D-(3,5/4)-trihydroxycyclohexane-1,2-dione acylhydrolase (decyclizing) [Balneolaceae bacterium]